MQDDEHFPVHNPADITVWARSEVSSPWTIQVNMTCPAADTTMVPVVKGPTTMRYWRLDIATRHNTPPSGTRVHARTSHTTAHIVSHSSNGYDQYHPIAYIVVRLGRLSAQIVSRQSVSVTIACTCTSGWHGHHAHTTHSLAETQTRTARCTHRFWAVGQCDHCLHFRLARAHCTYHT